MKLSLPLLAFFLLTAAIARATAFTSPPINCLYLAYDGCDFAPNQALHQAAGGSGWAANWLVQGDNISQPGYQAAASASSLSYEDLPLSGSRIQGGIDYLASGRRLNTQADGPFGTYVAGEEAIGSSAQGEVLWASMLLSKTANDNTEISAYFHADDLSWCFNCTQNRLGVGFYGDESVVNGQRRWSLLFGNTVITTDQVVNIGQPTLIVVKFTFETSSTGIELFINPSPLGTTTTPAPSLTYSTPTPLLIRSFAYYGGHTPNSSELDEIRFAQTYECVAPGANTPLLLPPVALFSINGTSTGVAPFSVTVDASASYSPQATALTYHWDFGDGSLPLITSTPTASHIYTSGLGERIITLTVTDTEGQTAAMQTSILLTDTNGNFPCTASITTHALADCSGGGGRLRVQVEEAASYSLRDANGQTLSPDEQGQYSNLALGTYTLNIAGNNGCSNTYPLQMPIDSSSCIGWVPNDCAMQIGTNLTGIADWAPHRAFRNFLKNTRPEPIPYTDNCDCWSIDYEVLATMSFDDNGYPTHLPQNTAFGPTRLRYFVSAEGFNMPPNQDYVLLYEGSGELSLHGLIENQSESPGRIQFRLGGDGTFWFQILSSQQGNHLRNIRILRLADEFADLENEPFYSVFLDKIRPFQNLRFMDWMSTNNNPLVRWEDRTQLDHFSYGSPGGAPYEIVVQLANQLKKNIWICVPHAADEAFITQMAHLFKNTLDPNLTIYLEYSNEVWNWIFEQAHYNNQNKPNGLNYGRAYALKSKRIFDIWHQVYGNEKDRVKRVIGIQAGFNYLNEQILATLDPNDWDYGSPTHYFGLEHGEEGSPRLDLLGSAATPDDVMDNALNHFNEFKDLVKQDYRNIQIFGKEVITYEGGQHFVGNVFGIPYDYQQAMWDAQNSDRMYEMYSMVLDSIKNWGCKLASNYSLTAPQESVFGSWGVLDDIDIMPPYALTAKKYQVHLDKLPPADCSEAPSSLAEKLRNTVPLRLFPNPATQSVTLHYEGLPAPIYLYRLTGDLVKSGFGYTLSLEGLPAGMYFVVCGQQIGKLLKL